MTGADLLAALQALTPEELALEAMSEGCDCFGATTGVMIVDNGGPVVLILREDDNAITAWRVPVKAAAVE